MSTKSEYEQLCQAERKRLASLRFQLLESHPFWGYLLLQMKLIFQPDLPTFAATDCLHTIWFNPNLTQQLSFKQLGFVLVHEICHSVFASMQRRGNRDPHLWNCATDYAINRIIMQIPQTPSWSRKPLYELPVIKLGRSSKSVLYDSQFDDMAAEMIYEKLAEEELQNPTMILLKLNLPGNGEEEGDYSDGEGENNGHGQRSIVFPNVSNHHGGVDVHIPIDLSPAQQEELFERIRAATEAWRKSSNRGHLPENEIRHLLPQRSRVPWNRILRQYAAQALAKEDYSLARPNKRYLMNDVVVPGLHSESVNLVVISLDSSGSMNEEALGKAMAEISKISDLVSEVLVIVSDCKIHQVVNTNELPAFVKEMKVKGGGGTSHLPVFEYIAEKHLQPDLFIGITDLESHFPDKAPVFPVIWLTPEDTSEEAPWGRVIEINDLKKKPG